MDVNSLTEYQATQAASASLSAAAGTSLGKDEFLRLLTVQMQHQDPMSPMDNQEMLAQLAQFSSLEQLSNINTNLQNNLDLNLLLTQVLSNTAAAGLVGKTVVANSNAVTLGSSGAASVGFNLDGAAERVVVTIKDSAGMTVRTLEGQDLEAGRNELAWDGKDANGRPVTAGTYSVTIQAFDSEGNEVAASTLTRGEVSGVRFKDGQAYLVVDGQEISISDVVEITG